MENKKSNQTEKKTAGSCPSAMNCYLFICFFVLLFSDFFISSASPKDIRKLSAAYYQSFLENNNY